MSEATKSIAGAPALGANITVPLSAPSQTLTASINGNICMSDVREITNEEIDAIMTRVFAS